MNNNIDNEKLGTIIRDATNKIVEQTEKFVESADTNPIGEDIVTVMVNGTETKLSQADYETLKDQNKAIHLQMKTDIKAVVTEMKQELKNNVSKK